MTYIIGVDHLIQYDNGIVPGKIFHDFTGYLAGKARALDIGLMAEEFSEEALFRVYCATTATVKKVTEELGIEHRFCDPEENDRIRLGIPYFADIKDSVKKTHHTALTFVLNDALRIKIDKETADISKTFWELREEFWFSRILDCLDRNIIFVCGHEHAERFSDLMTRKGAGSIVLEKFWGKEIFSDYDKLFSR